MNTAGWVAVFVAGWVVLAFALGVLVGKAIKRRGGGDT